VEFGVKSGQRFAFVGMKKEDLSKDEVIDLTKRCLQQYQEKAKKRERMAWSLTELEMTYLKYIIPNL
jgi:NAD(P)H-nitrite reductase large subunit